MHDIKVPLMALIVQVNDIFFRKGIKGEQYKFMFFNSKNIYRI